MNRKSEIFKEYNKIKAQTRKAGKDTKRADRALGLSLSGEERPYLTTSHTCDCPDSRFRGATCKHQIRQQIVTAPKTTDQLLAELGF